MISAFICGLVLAAVGLRFIAHKLSPSVRIGFAVVMLLWALLPFPYGSAGWVLAFSSDFSISTGLLALMAIVHRVRAQPSLNRTELRLLCVVIALLALLFYPLSLGVTSLDPYAWGYGDFRFSTAILLIGLLAWIMRVYAGCTLLIAAQCAYWAGALSSNNLWDYLIDPWLCFWVFGWLIRDAITQRRGLQTA